MFVVSVLPAEVTHSRALIHHVDETAVADPVSPGRLPVFGGWPLEILYDNMKQVRLDREQWNPLFIDFASHYGIVVKTHRIRRPRTRRS
jgi:transposase